MNYIPHNQVTKKHCQRWHAQQRLQERFGLSLSGRKYKELRRIVAESVDECRADKRKARLVEVQSRRVSVWALIWQGVELLAVFDEKRREIVTFLFPGEETERAA